MAEPEINIKVTANTDDAKKGIAEVTNELKKMNTSGSDKAADELDKVTEAADKTTNSTENLNKAWDEYKRKVKEADEAVRELNSTQFENAEQRDAAINKLGDKLDELVYKGKAIEDSMKALGVPPTALDGFNSVFNILQQTNKQFDIALNNRERLLNQPSVPDEPIVSSYPWEEGANGTGPEGFGNRYQEAQEKVMALREEIEAAVSVLQKQKNAFHEEYEALNESAEGYLERKKLLEQLIGSSETLQASLDSQLAQIKKHASSLYEINTETNQTAYWENGIKKLEEFGVTSDRIEQKVAKNNQQLMGLTNKYNNAVFSANDKRAKQEQRIFEKEEAQRAKEEEYLKKVQKRIDVAGKSREELIRLVEEYGKALSEAKTKEEYEAAAAGISVARKQLTLLTREASLTGSAMIGAQTSVQGVVSTIGRLGAQGRLTLQGLTQGIKLFAKSTVVLAAIQFAWEGISWAMEKAKTAIFGAADAEEKAKKEAEDLASAAKAAADNLASANETLKEWESDKIRAEQAQAYADAVKKQNEYYSEQLNLIDEATAADLRRYALNADEKEKEIALEKLRLQREKMLGTISEYDYQKKMIELETKLVSIRGNAKVDAASIKEEDARKRANEAAKQLDAAMMEKSDFDQFVFSPAQLATMVAQYGLDEAKIKKYEHLFKERATLSDTVRTRKELIQSGKLNFQPELLNRYLAELPEQEKKLKELNDMLREIDGLEARSVASFNSMPEQIRSALESGNEQAIKFALEEYGKNYQAAEARDKDIKKRQDEAAKAVEKADQAVLDASAAKTNAYQDAANADTFRAKQAEEELATLKAQEEERLAQKANKKKIDAAQKRVQKMEFDHLERKEAEMRALSEMYNEETPEGKRRRALAKVYTDEYEKRVEKATSAGQQIVQQGETASGKAARVVNRAGEIAYESTLKKGVNIKDAISVLKDALNTESRADDMAAVELYNLLQKLMSKSQKASKEAKELKARYQKLLNKLNDPSR